MAIRLHPPNFTVTVVSLLFLALAIPGEHFPEHHLSARQVHRSDIHHHHHHHTESAAIKPSDEKHYDKMIQIGDGKRFLFYWRILSTSTSSDENDVLHAQLAYSGKAWLGFGVTKKHGKLNGSHVLIGKPHHHHQLQWYKLTGDEWTSAELLSTQDLEGETLFQNETITTMQFKTTLRKRSDDVDEQGTEEISIRSNGKHTFLFAFGKDNHLVNNIEKTFELSLDLSTTNSAVITKGPTTLFVPSQKPSAFITAVPSTGVPTGAPAANSEKPSQSKDSSWSTMDITAVTILLVVMLCCCMKLYCQPTEEDDVSEKDPLTNPLFLDEVNFESEKGFAIDQ